LLEDTRRIGAKTLEILKSNKIKKAVFTNLTENTNYTIAFAEGLALANYQFLKYKQKAKEAQQGSLDSNELATMIQQCVGGKR